MAQFWAFEDAFPAKLDLVDELSANSHNRQMDSKWRALYAFVGFKNCFACEKGVPQNSMDVFRVWKIWVWAEPGLRLKPPLEAPLKIFFL